MTTQAREVVLSNCGGGPLMVTGASITGVDAADFTIVSPVTARELATGESMAFLVVMTPHGIGHKSAQLAIQHANGTATADLDGDGYGGDGGGVVDRETYYACSAGGAPAWPIALVLLALRRRRR